MPYPEPRHPYLQWDGLTDNLDRVTTNSNVNPSAEDWERIAAEVISMQDNPGGALLSPITSSGPIIVIDDDSIQHPPTTSILALADATAGAITIDLPPAADMAGKTVDIKKIDSSINSVTLDGDGAETIDGSLTQVLTAQYDEITVLSDGTAWYII
jgi:hypothetical protein